MRSMPIPAALGEMLRYGSVGGISALVELGLFHLAHRVFGFSIMASNVAAVTSVLVFGFMAQKKFTFRDTRKAYPQAGLYVLLVGISFFLNNALVFLFAVVLGVQPVIAKIFQLAIGFGFNFAFSKYVVFRGPRESQTAIP